MLRTFVTFVCKPPSLRSNHRRKNKKAGCELSDMLRWMIPDLLTFVGAVQQILKENTRVLLKTCIIWYALPSFVYEIMACRAWREGQAHFLNHSSLITSLTINPLGLPFLRHNEKEAFYSTQFHWITVSKAISSEETLLLSPLLLKPRSLQLAVLRGTHWAWSQTHQLRARRISQPSDKQPGFCVYREGRISVI